MKNILLKVGLVIFVFALLAAVPLKLTFGYGSTPSCGKEKPTQVVLYEPNHPLLPKATGVGEVRLNWLKAERADKYTIGFGLSPNNYIYGATNLPNIDNYTVNHLNTGTRYYFAVRGVNDCMPGDWSREWSVVVGRAGGTSRLTSTGSTRNNVVPSIVQKRQGTGGNVIPSTVVPTVENQNLPPVVEPTPRPGFFQRIFNLFFGRR